MLALRKDGKDAVGWRGKLFQHHLQSAGGHVLLDLPGAAPGQAQTAQAPLVQDLAIAAVQRSAGTQMGQLAVDRERPAPRLAAVRTECQAGVAHQFSRSGRCAGALQIGRRGHTKTPVFGQAHADQAGIGQVADAHGAVETLVDDVHLSLIHI